MKLMGEKEAMNDKLIEELKQKIAELKAKWPAHSVSAVLVQELDDLEEQLEDALKEQSAE